MKYAVALILIGLAALEFFYQLHEGHALDAITCAEPRGASQNRQARELLQQHLHNHR